MDRAARRLGLAIAGSLAIHVALIVPWSLPRLADPSEGIQVPIVATLRPGAVENPAKPPPGGPKAGTDRGGAERSLLSVPGGPIPVPTARAPETPERSPESPVAEETTSFILQQAQPPEYPQAALRDGLEGCVLAAVQVDGSGEVASVEIVAADLPEVFDQAVIESQKTARYAPARGGDGQAVASRVLAVAEFVILPGRRLYCALKYTPEARRLVGSGSP